MGKNISKNTIINPETGEIISETMTYKYDGFNDTGFRYRFKSSAKVEVHFDALPPNLSPDSFRLLMMLAEVMNSENIFIKQTITKNKFFPVDTKPMTLDEIRLACRFKYGVNRFQRCWYELKKQCIRRVKYYDILVFAINPAFINKAYYVPFWLYDYFQDYMNPYLSAQTIKKLQSKVDYDD